MNANSISKDVILKHTNCNDIYTKFLGLNDFPYGKISSPFSDDKKPSFKVYKANETFKSNSTGKQGDVWQFFAVLKNLDCKINFNEVLEIIAMEMNLPLQYNCNSPEVKHKTAKSTRKPSNTSIAIQLQYNCNENEPIIAMEKSASKSLDYEDK